MKGLEMMLASMVGISPDQMRATMEGLMNAATSGVETLKRIEANQLEIMQRLERLENANGDGNKGNGAN